MTLLLLTGYDTGGTGVKKNRQSERIQRAEAPVRAEGGNRPEKERNKTMNQTRVIPFALAAAMALAHTAFGEVVQMPGPVQIATLTPVRVQLEWTTGGPTAWTTNPVHLLVIVTDFKTGQPITNLEPGNFSFLYLTPRCVPMPSDFQISTFIAHATNHGAYYIELKPAATPLCNPLWSGADEGAATQVVVYQPASPLAFNPSPGRYGVTTMRMDVQ